MRIPSLGPHEIHTSSGKLVEFPMSMVEALGRRINMFGGGYLRLSPLVLIRWGVRQLQNSGQPVIVYIHPREVDPDHPRLRLGPVRRFKSYVGLKTTLPKLRWLCSELDTRTMGELADAFASEQKISRPPSQTA